MAFHETIPAELLIFDAECPFRGKYLVRSHQIDRQCFIKGWICSVMGKMFHEQANRPFCGIGRTETQVWQCTKQERRVKPAPTGQNC